MNGEDPREKEGGLVATCEESDSAQIHGHHLSILSMPPRVSKVRFHLIWGEKHHWEMFEAS